jgi:hypothetical protein
VSKRRDLNKREAEILVALANMQAEFGPDAQFTRAAVELVVGSKCAGSLAGLAMLGYATQRKGPEGLAYRMTDTGIAAVRIILEGRRPITVNGHDRSQS